MSSIPGTNVPPVSFPGIASGIDYNSIISKLTSLTLQQNVSLNAQIATLNAANTELIKINNLLNCVQNALGSLSNPNIFNAYNATSSNTVEGSASVISGATPASGVYTITNQVLATATTITNNAAAGHSITDSNSQNLIIAKSFAAVTPSNGSSSSGNGTVTVNGVQITYNVNVDSVNSILSKIQSQVQAATGDASFTATLNASGQVVISSTTRPISLGSASDSGNILQVFKLTTAQITNTATSGSVTSTSNIGGINQAASFNSTTNAGYVTPVTSGFFTINGVTISVSASGDNTASVIARINASNAGVVASYDATTNKIALTASATGPQSIVVGASGDTSNFLTAAGLTTAAGATTTIGSQAQVTFTSPSGTSQTVYSNSNSVTNAIAGVQLNIGSFTSPYTVTVGSDSSQLVNAVNNFASAYNAAVTEINNATIPPAIIQPEANSSSAGATSASVGGGVLWNNSDIIGVKNELTNLVSGFLGSSTGYNSLSLVGLDLTSQFTILSTSANSGPNSQGSSSQPVTTQSLSGTDGTFQPLNLAKLQAALAANPTQVQQLFIGSTGLTSTLGNYLGNVTGLPTLLNNGLVGQLSAGGTAIIQGFENTNTDAITSIGQQIKQITDNANAQADQLRQEFVQTEAQIAQYQSLQSQLAGFFKSAGG